MEKGTIRWRHPYPLRAKTRSGRLGKRWPSSLRLTPNSANWPRSIRRRQSGTRVKWRNLSERAKGAVVPNPDQGRIVWAEVDDPHGSNRKHRPLVIISKLTDLPPGEPLLAVAATGT